MSKIPAHATCVFKGVIFDVYQWEQELYDGTMATFEALRRPDTVVVFALNGDKIFYAQQEQPGKLPFLSLFGGRADEGEEPLQAAKRELLEETGMVSDSWRQIRHHRSGGKIDWNIYYFVAADCRKVADPELDGGEMIEVLSTTIDDFIDNIATSADFAEREIRQEILSAFNQHAADALKAELLGTTSK